MTEKRRGESIGTLLYWTFKPCYARVREDNLASIRSAQKAGYRALPQTTKEKDDGVVVLAS